MLSPSDGEQSDARGAHVAPAAPRKPPERRAFLAGEAGMKLMDGYLSEKAELWEHCTHKLGPILKCFTDRLE